MESLEHEIGAWRQCAPKKMANWAKFSQKKKFDFIFIDSLAGISTVSHLLFIIYMYLYLIIIIIFICFAKDLSTTHLNLGTYKKLGRTVVTYFVKFSNKFSSVRYEKIPTNIKKKKKKLQGYKKE